jgi:hypothetical protein
VLAEALGTARHRRRKPCKRKRNDSLATFPSTDAIITRLDDLVDYFSLKKQGIEHFQQVN